MATIGSIAVNIIATTDKFVAGLNQAQTRLGRFVSKISAAHGIVAGFGVYALGSVVTRAIETGGALADVSGKLDIATDALGALRYGAVQLGGSAESLDNSLTFMRKNIGELAAGSKGAQESFGRLGLTFDQLRGLRTEQQFLAIVDAVNRLPNGMEKTAASMRIFGRGAGELQGVISAGTEALVKLGDEAARTGQLISTEQAEALDAASDSIAALSTSWQSFTQSMTAVFAPVLTVAFKGMTYLLTAFRTGWQLTSLQITGVIELIIKAVAKLADWMNVLLPKFAELPVDNLNAIADAFAQQRQRQWAEIVGKSPLSRGTSGGGSVLQQQPKPTVEEKATATNTGMQVKQLNEVIKELRQSPRLAVAGVR